jgi:hypothetical protein
MTTKTQDDRDDLDDAVLATVAYSDVFDMPASLHEVERYLVGVRASGDQVSTAADRVVARGALRRRGQLLYLPGRESVLAVHADRSARAARMWPQARRWVRILGLIPFVRSVAVTGGLAADSVEDFDDIDLFVITAPRRLWLTRLAVVVVVRMVGLRGPELCPNYLVTTEALELDVRTQYVARELAQTIPLVGVDLWRELLDLNSWHRAELPNAIPRDTMEVGSGRPGWLRRVVERLLGLSFFDRIETWEMQRKIARLARNPSRRPEVGSPDESSFSPSVCKGHMEGNAAGIEVAWRERLDHAEREVR